MNKDIEEMIADAKAEEEVRAEQENAVKDDFRGQLRKQLREACKTQDEEKVTISLSEYVLLKTKEMDLDRIFNAIVEALELSYSKEYLVLRSSDRVAETFRALYPDVYDSLLALEYDYAEQEGE